MFRFLGSFLLGALSFLLLIFNTLFWAAIVMPTAFVKVIFPLAKIRLKLLSLLNWFASGWAYCCCIILRIVGKLRWNTGDIKGLSPDQSYLVVCNHRSWADVFALAHIFRGRIPFMKFFLKKELFWLPILGIVWWAMDYPFMKRYSKAFLKKKPELKGKDMEATRKFCQKFKSTPISIMNFLEGTRFSFQKHQKQSSPYSHLLRPRAGGIAVALSSMGDYLSKVLDVTIVYPENKPPVTFWQLLKGDVSSIVVRIQSLNVPDSFLNKNYQEDKGFQKEIRQWVNWIWREKDRRIQDILDQYPALSGKSSLPDDKYK